MHRTSSTDCRPHIATAHGARRARRLVLIALAVALVAGTTGTQRLQAWQAEDSFDLSRTTVPREKLVSGGPPKDGIPAIDNPQFIRADKAHFLKPADLVAGVVINGEARAYPLKILDYHEAVNDRIGRIPFVVTFCPLADSVLVFDRRLPEGEREFGVSGFLYNSNLVLYIRNPGNARSVTALTRLDVWSHVGHCSRFSVILSALFTYVGPTDRASEIACRTLITVVLSTLNLSARSSAFVRFSSQREEFCLGPQE